jgi:hypothetical protein
MQFHAKAGVALSALLFATISNAQTPASQQQLSLRQRLQQPATALNPQPATPAPSAPQPQQVSQPAGSLLDQPAQPAKVTFSNGKLAVQANNSSLAEILHEISQETGTKVNPVPGDHRIFGDYGPGAPKEILSALLDGFGYNMLMVGALENGAPRELTLTQRSQTSMAQAQPNPIARQASNNDDDSDDSSADQQPAEPVPPPRPETNMPPDANQQQPANGQPGAVKSPQQLLQELQQMHQQQQQQNNPQ